MLKSWSYITESFKVNRAFQCPLLPHPVILLWPEFVLEGMAVLSFFALCAFLIDQVDKLVQKRSENGHTLKCIRLAVKQQIGIYLIRCSSGVNTKLDSSWNPSIHNGSLCSFLLTSTAILS